MIFMKKFNKFNKNKKCNLLNTFVKNHFFQGEIVSCSCHSNILFLTDQKDDFFSMLEPMVTFLGLTLLLKKRFFRHSVCVIVVIFFTF